MAVSQRAAVVGARRRAQGTGPYVARELARQGWDVAAIVGTREETVAEARAELRERFGIACRGYTSLERLLEAEQVEAVAICSPAEFHLEQAEQSLAAGCHVFCEKPLWWEERLYGLDARAELAERAGALHAEASARGLSFTLNTQWPFTLEGFRALHPEAYGEARPVEHYAMHMGPTGSGAEMMKDSGSHLLSMLYALVGPGSLVGVEVELERADRKQMSCRFGFRHAGGETAVRFELRHCPRSPRPAGYAINGHPVEREIELPEYRQFFAAGERRVPLPDPLTASVADFTQAVQTRRPPERTALVDGMVQLHELVAAVATREAEG